MSLSGPALRLTIVIGESDQWHHKPLYSEIVRRAQRTGLAGATVLRGIEVTEGLIVLDECEVIRYVGRS